jgi:hypothetical protein
MINFVMPTGMSAILDATMQNETSPTKDAHCAREPQTAQILANQGAHVEVHEERIAAASSSRVNSI